MLKYKLKLKDVKLEDFRVYLFALFKNIFPKKKIRNNKDLKSFIQKKSAWVSQVTLYKYFWHCLSHDNHKKLLDMIDYKK